jgi:hypothetical protein
VLQLFYAAAASRFGGVCGSGAPTTTSRIGAPIITTRTSIVN